MTSTCICPTTHAHSHVPPQVGGELFLCRPDVMGPSCWDVQGPIPAQLPGTRIACASPSVLIPTQGGPGTQAASGAGVQRTVVQAAVSVPPGVEVLLGHHAHTASEAGDGAEVVEVVACTAMGYVPLQLVHATSAAVPGGREVVHEVGWVQRRAQHWNMHWCA